MPRAIAPDEKAVFLNVPFDKGYEKLFIALIASIVCLGRKPRCVLELAERGQGRLRRIVRHLEACRVSVHDLSRVGQPARFNMPFELGLAYALRTYKNPRMPYYFILLEKERYRLGKTLSDMSAHDPYVHEDRTTGVITAILDALSTGRRNPQTLQIHRIWKKLMKASRNLKRDHGSDTVYSRTIFKRLVAAAGILAAQEKLIQR